MVINPANVQESFGDIGLYIEPVYGARVWNMDAETGALRGAWRNKWDVGENVATCHIDNSQRRHEDDELVVEDCTCGFYAYWNSAQLSNYLQWTAFWQNALLTEAATIFGVIKAYGRVLIGTEGFRAENAEIVALTTIGRAEKFPISPWSKNSDDLMDEVNRIFNTNFKAPPRGRWTDKDFTMRVEPREDYLEAIPLFSSIPHMLKEFPCTKP